MKRLCFAFPLLFAALLTAGEPLRVPAEVPVVEKRESWQETISELEAAGVPKNWLLVGPVKDTNFKLYDSETRHLAEIGDDWSKLGAKEWTRPENEEGCLIDLSEALNARFDVFAFAQTEIDWPVEGPALIWFDSYGRSTVFLNNIKVDTGPAKNRATDPGEVLYPIEVQMRRGKNILKIKNGQDRSPYFKGWGFSVRVERNDLPYRQALFEKLCSLYPDEATGPFGADAHLEIARRLELSTNFTAAEVAYEKIEKQFAQHANADYQIEAAEGRKRCQSKRKDADSSISAIWKKVESQTRALIAAGDSQGASNLLREFIAKYPFDETAGVALCMRGALHQDYCQLQTASSLFSRALREFPGAQNVRRISQSSLASIRSFRPDKVDVDLDHNVQGMVDGVRRQLSTGFAHDVEAAAKSAAEIVRDFPEAILRISDTPLFSRYVGLREYMRALIVTFPDDALSAYSKSLAQVSYQQYRAARELGGMLELESVAWNYYYTPAAAKALNDAGNLYMDRGANSQALFTFRLLQRDYSSQLSADKEAGINPAHLAAKIARLLIETGNHSEAESALQQLKEKYGAAEFNFGGKAITGTAYAEVFQTKLKSAQSGSVATDNLQDTATFGGNMSRTGSSVSGKTILKSGPCAWTEVLARSASANVARDYWPEDTVYTHLQSYPVIQGNVAYLSTFESVLAIDLRSGKKLWHQSWDSRGSLFDDGGRPLFTGHPLSSPTVSGEKVFVRALQNRQSSLRSYDCASGKLIWSTDTQSALKKMVWISEPLVAYGLVIGVFLENPLQLDVEPAGRAPSYTHGVAALDVQTGELRWKRNLISGTNGMRVVERSRGRNNKEWASYRSTMQLGPPAADNGVIYTQTGLASVAALNAFTGELIWLSGYPRVKAESLENGNSGMERFVPRVLKLLARGPMSPIVGDDVVIVAPKDAGGVFAFEKHGGNIRWMQEVLDCRFLAGVCDGNVLAVDDMVTAISMKTGRVQWEYSLTDYSRGLYAQPGYFGGLLYLPTKENLQVVDAHTGKAISAVTWDPKIGPLANIAITNEYSVGVNGRVLAPILVGQKP